MSWANIKATGRGGLEFRLMIEGWPYEFVSHVDMERTTNDYRIRIAGLDRKGLVLEEQSKPHLAELEGRAITARIVDRQKDDAATAAFFTLPSKTTWLAADVTTASTTFSLLNNTALWGLSSGADNVFHIGTEAVLAGGIGASDGAGNPTITGCTRGYWDTIAQAHYTFDATDGLGEARMTDQPLGMEGRRAYLYVYGDGDSLTSTGTLVWRGICSTDARLTDDGCTWEVSIDPIMRVLEQEIGADLEDEQTVRGIYYPQSAPLVIHVEEATDENIPAGGLSGGFSFIYGFFESNEDLMVEVQSRLDTITSSYSGTYTAVAQGNDDWWIRCDTASASPKYPLMGFMSIVDGVNGWVYFTGGGAIADEDADATPVSSVSTSRSYRTVNRSNFVQGSRQVPRGHLGTRDPDGTIMDDRDASAWLPPANGTPTDAFNIFPGGHFSLSGLVGASIELSKAGTTYTTTIGSVDATGRYIGLDGLSPEMRGPYTPHPDHALTFTTTISLEANGTVADVRDYIVNNSPTECNRARLPLVTDSDLASWTAVVDGAKEAPFTANRSFFVVDAVTLAEYFREEWRLLGVFPALDSSGKITVRSLSVPLATDAGIVSLTASEHLIDDGFATWERNSWGTLNAIRISLGYDPREDAYSSHVVIRDKGTYPNRKAPKHLTIEPKSRVNPIVAFHTEPGVINSDVVSVGSRALGLFGRDYAVIQAGVPLTMFDTLVGAIRTCQRSTYITST